jgi:hypothetical protein
MVNAWLTDGALLMEQYVLTAVIAVLGTTMSILLGMILNRLNKLEEKLEAKLDKVDCETRRYACRLEIGKQIEREDEDIKDLYACKEKEHEELWETFGRHSHTGLPADSKVTR